MNNDWLIKQQEFIDRLFTEHRGNSLALAVVLWSLGPMSRAERRMFPTLKAIAEFKWAEMQCGRPCP